MEKVGPTELSSPFPEEASLPWKQDAKIEREHRSTEVVPTSSHA